MIRSAAPVSAATFGIPYNTLVSSDSAIVLPPLDLIEATIENIGTLTNKVILEGEE